MTTVSSTSVVPGRHLGWRNHHEPVVERSSDSRAQVEVLIGLGFQSFLLKDLWKINAETKFLKNLRNNPVKSGFPKQHRRRVPARHKSAGEVFRAGLNPGLQFLDWKPGRRVDFRTGKAERSMILAAVKTDMLPTRRL
jgi:hypothetical protein